ncbi:MAG: hypothetical protein ACFE7A_05830 [Promethearchaeota archaeon]
MVMSALLGSLFAGWNSVKKPVFLPIEEGLVPTMMAELKNARYHKGHHSLAKSKKGKLVLTDKYLFFEYGFLRKYRFFVGVWDITRMTYSQGFINFDYIDRSGTSQTQESR